MAKNNEEIKNETVTEKTAVTPEVKTEKVEEVKTEKQEDKKTEKSLTANRTFVDRYTREIYEKGTEFIIADVEETEKISDKKYKISQARADQIKAKGYAD